VSASPGIAGNDEREERREADRALADHIEDVGVASFVDEWLARPMFAGLEGRGEAWRVADRAMRTSNRAEGLAGALRSLGPGCQPWLGPRLGALRLPVLLIVGERDRRYVDLARLMADELRSAETVVVGGAGHAVVGEDPEAVAAAIGRWRGR
jgi:2-succinyl-6-hydroxy-2,4-cyclohexadiene-1-carboxylate synthase